MDDEEEEELVLARESSSDIPSLGGANRKHNSEKGSGAKNAPNNLNSRYNSFKFNCESFAQETIFKLTSGS